MKAIGNGASHAKVILIGEHSVVYGQPAIVLPIPTITTNVIITQAKGDVHTIDSRYFKGPVEDLHANMFGLHRLINELIAKFNGQRDFWNLEITSMIPAERGMGSSAATAVAITRAFFDYYESPLTYQELLDFVAIEEQITHTNPSGVDAAMTSGNLPIIYDQANGAQPIKLNLDATLLVVDTGIKGQTGKAVQSIAAKMKIDKQSTTNLITRLGDLTYQSKRALSSNDPKFLGGIMNEAQKILTSLGVSHPTLNKYVTIANNIGAYGAKLTGGGRGGCLIALVPNHEVAQKIAKVLVNEGATSTWLLPLQMESENKV